MLFSVSFKVSFSVSFKISPNSEFLLFRWEVLSLILSLAFGSKQYQFSISNRSYLINEILSIQNNLIESSNFIFPYISNSSNESYDIMNSNKNYNLYPVLGVRYSNSSFELFPEYININSVKW